MRYLKEFKYITSSQIICTELVPLLVPHLTTSVVIDRVSEAGQWYRLKCHELRGACYQFMDAMPGITGGQPMR